MKEPWLAAAHAGTCRSRGPPAGSRLPLWAQEERPRRMGAEARLQRRSGACPTTPTALPFTIQAPRLSLELLEADAELLAACATAAQALLTGVDKVRPPPTRLPHPLWAVAAASRLRSVCSGPTVSRSATGRSRRRVRLASRSRSCTSTRTCTCCSLSGTVPRSRLCCRESRLECVSERIYFAREDL